MIVLRVSMSGPLYCLTVTMPPSNQAFGGPATPRFTLVQYLLSLRNSCNPLFVVFRWMKPTNRAGWGEGGILHRPAYNNLVIDSTDDAMFEGSLLRYDAYLFNSEIGPRSTPAPAGKPQVPVHRPRFSCASVRRDPAMNSPSSHPSGKSAGY
jgi:hypothetical protein